MPLQGQDFLDVQLLLDRSQVRARGNWFWYGLGVFALLVMASSYFAAKSQQAAAVVNLLSMVLMLGVGAMLAMLTVRAIARQRREQQQVEAIEELVQLRRWDQAAGLLQELLSHPLRHPPARVQALIYLASVLARYHRFDDAIAVQEYLLDHHLVDPMSEYGLRLGRAMAQLRQDHLVDASQSISELRRFVGDHRSGGLAMVEMYRDIRTGHPSEALEIFKANLDVLREQLGHRLADAYGLAAVAFDQLGQRDEAQRHYSDATTLSSVDELNRRYPEVAGLAGKLIAAAVPTEAA